MKNKIITAAVIYMICLSNLQAQNAPAVTTSVAKQFDTRFSGASNVQWTKAGQMFMAKFQYQENTWVAYFNADGEIHASGRKINSLDQLPIQVKQGISRVKNSQESKFGSIETSYAVELIEQGITKYYIPMANSNVSFMVGVDNGGNTTIYDKQRKGTPARPEKDLIARRN